MNSSVNKLLLTMAQNLLRAGQTDLALSTYRRYVGLEPDNVDALLKLGELLFQANESDQAAEVFERAIRVDPQRMDLRLSFAKHLIKSQRTDQAEGVINEALLRAPARKEYLIRQTQLFFRKMPDKTVQIEECVVRIGDLVALMICAEYVKRYEGRRIVFQLMDETHKALKADVLFKDTIDQIVTVEGPNFGLSDPAGPEVYDPGDLWIATTFYHARYGGLVVPKLNLDPTHYKGPDLMWGTYAIFSPLFDPPYNEPRGMDEAFVNEFCERLYDALGERAIVITDQPWKIHSKIRAITTDCLYDIAYIVGKSKVFLGGDTGFTHIAAAGRVPNLFALYGANYGPDFGAAITDLCFGDLVHAFVVPGKYWGTRVDTRPKFDPDETKLHFYLLQDNRMTGLEMDAIVNSIKEIMNE